MKYKKKVTFMNMDVKIPSKMLAISKKDTKSLASWIYSRNARYLLKNQSV